MLEDKSVNNGNQNLYAKLKKKKKKLFIFIFKRMKEYTIISASAADELQSIPYYSQNKQTKTSMMKSNSFASNLMGGKKAQKFFMPLNTRVQLWDSLTLLLQPPYHLIL